MNSDANDPANAPESGKPLLADAPATPATAGAVAGRLRAYAARLAAAGAQPLAAVVDGYALRVEGAARDELPPSASANPSALTPALAGEALGRGPVPRLAVAAIEILRNVLIFTPVLWTWYEFGRASERYNDYFRGLPDGAGADSFLVWWQGNGLAITISVAVALLLSIIIATLALSVFRAWAERDKARHASAFAVLLAEAEGVGATQRAADPQEALAAFAAAGRDLTAELREAGASLASSVQPLGDSVEQARTVMTDMSAAIGSQREQSEAIVSSLGRVSDVADRLAAIESSFAEARGAAQQGADALDGIRRSLEPQAGEIARAAAGLDGLATAIGDTAAALARATGEHGELLAAHAEGAGRFREAASTMQDVAGAIGGVSDVADRLGALESTFGEMRDAGKANAEALDGVRASLEPQAERYSDATERIAGIAERIDRAVAQIGRATEDYGKSLQGFADGAEQLGEAARTMNAVAIRLRDDMAAAP